MSIHGLERILGFKVDCPRCRPWQIFYKNSQKTVLLKCSNCGLEREMTNQKLEEYVQAVKRLILKEEGKPVTG